ncbi:MAG: class I SAM-dependent methyltransferase [Chloroflexi bacterium]|nr:class I SAM-dependent methyltransferase [Chloroflexota bacterium]
MAENDKAISWGHPSYVWRYGQDRRLAILRRYAPLDGKKILDVGCGIGTYLARFRAFSPQVYGVDIDRDKVKQGSRELPYLATACAENLPFQDGVFDVILLHEVLEHVTDDGEALQEAYRVAKEGGRIVIYVPNRLYPFETHGFYLGKRYVFGLLPLVNYLPQPLRRLLVPHVRVYLGRDLKRLFRGLMVAVIAHSYLFPGFDGIAARRPWLGRLLRYLIYPLERSPLRIFGLSHFLVLEKEAPGGNNGPE